MIKKISVLILAIFTYFACPNLGYSTTQPINASKKYLNTLILNKISRTYFNAVDTSNFEWTELNNGKFKVTVPYGKNKIQIEFTQQEMISASKGKSSNLTKDKINKAIPLAPGGGGPPQ